MHALSFISTQGSAIVAWSERVLGATLDVSNVVPSIGSKELVALLPSLLGLEPGTQVLLPTMAYPTYDVGARLAGCVPVATDDPTAHDVQTPSTSVKAGPPVGPSSPGTIRRTTTRDPTTCGPRAVEGMGTD